MLQKILRNDYFQMLTFLVALAGLMWGTVWTLNTRLEDRMNARFDSIDIRFDKIESRLEKIDTRLDSFGERIAKNEARLDALK